MKDKYGRVIDYLRISLTENCNIRCLYCMPDWSCKDFQEDKSMLTTEEIIKISKLFSKFGIKKIRLTGGEPLLRRDIQEIIKGISKISNIEEICLTTNGLLLESKVEELKKNGLNRVNISLDTTDEEEYKKLTRGGELKKVLRAVKRCRELNIPVKINAVITNLQKAESIINLAKLTENDSLDIRFIELMPIGLGKGLKGFTGQDIINILEKKYILENLYTFEGTSKYYKIEGYKGRIGVINPMSECFCETCNRVRITSNGELKSCLSSEKTLNIKELLNDKYSEEERERIILETIFNRNEKNIFNTSDSEKMNMNKIGG